MAPKRTMKNPRSVTDTPNDFEREALTALEATGETERYGLHVISTAVVWGFP